MIDFGNGIEAGGTSRDDPRIYDHSGLRYPTVVVPVSENSGDGGVIGTSRAKARRMSVAMDFSTLTRDEVAAAFSPGVLRTVSSDRGSMPYYVEDVVFVDPDNASASFGAVVTVVSSYAYPWGATITASAASPFEYATTTYSTGTSLTPPDSGTVSVAQTFNAASGQMVGACGIYLKTKTFGSATVKLYRLPGAPGATIDITGATLLATISRSVSTIGSTIMATPDAELSDGDYYLITARFSTSSVNAHRDTAAGTATGAGYYSVDGVTFAAGDGTDATVDFRHSFTLGTVAAATTTVYLDPQTEVPCYPIVTVTLAGAETSLAITDGVRTATITHAFDAGDVIVLDSANLTVTINGTDAIADFDRAGDFLMLDTDSGYLATSEPGTIAVEWRPRKLGLL